MKMIDAISQTLSATQQGVFVGRAWRAGSGPSVVTIRRGRLIDITSKVLQTVRDIMEHADPVAIVNAAEGPDIGDLADW